MRKYVILSRQAADQHWAEHDGPVEAHSPEGAIKKAFAADKRNGRVFAAVPERNWTVAKPTVKQVEPVIELELLAGERTDTPEPEPATA